MAATGSSADGALDLETEWRELDALAVVDTIRLDKVTEKERGIGAPIAETDLAICAVVWVDPPGRRSLDALCHVQQEHGASARARRAGLAAQDRQQARRLPRGSRGRTSCRCLSKQPAAA